MRILLLSFLLSTLAYAYEPMVTIEYDVVKRTQSDILFVIDNSGSMNGHQTTLTEINDVLIDELKANNFKITAISTDKEDGLSNLTIDFMTVNPVERLGQLIKSFGVDGSPYEVPFTRVMTFYESDIGKKFFRTNSSKEVIILTDEDDQSEIETTLFTGLMTSEKTVVSALANAPDDQECDSRQSGALRIDNAVTELGGKFVNLCKFNREKLLSEYRELAAGIAKRATQTRELTAPIRELTLPSKVDADTIEVFYGSQVIKRGLNRTGWIIDEDENKIIFGNRIILSESEPVGTKFTIRYSVL